MVRNNKGGKKSKGLARKFVGAPVQRKLRLVENSGELYAAVTKILGGGMLEVKGLDGKPRICIIRQKFRGRGKRDNMVALGSWILIGERDWETVKKDQLSKCDLLEVYSSSEIEQLQKTDIDWTPIADIEDKHGVRKMENDNSIIFKEEADEEQLDADEEQVESSTILQIDDTCEIDIDDI